MDFFQNFQKKISSSEKKLKCCILTKVRPLHTAAPAPVQSNTVVTDASDLGIYVPRPPPEVRLVIFKELGDCDRPILFDSKCFKKNSVKACEKYTYVRSPTDWKVLSEMLFGSVGMAQKAASLKIHAIKSPPSLMLSRVLPKECATASFDRSFENSFEYQRNNSILSRRKANTMPVPLPASTPSSVASSCSSQSGYFPRSDSGISLSSTTSSSYLPSPGQIGSGSIYLPYGRAHSLPKNKRDSFTSSDEQTSNERMIRRNRIKIGFAVICQPEPSDLENFQRFFFEHFPIIESHMTALKEQIEGIFKLKPKQNFNEMMMKALDDFFSRLVTLYSSPRLPEPVWSTLNCPTLASDHRRIVVESFLGDLTRLVTDHNTKQKNCFVSALLTAVLTHHLGWVTSVTPSLSKSTEHDENDHNALWAQLGDLYGAVGSPTKVCRTIVTGSCHEVVSTFLSLISYFIRSSRVDEVIDVPSDITPSSLHLQTIPPLPTVTERLVSCDLDDSEYVCYSLDENESNQDDADDNEAFEHSDKVIKKNPVSRRKSSPQKSQTNLSDDDDVVTSLTRSFSGPMIKKKGRPRSNAITDNQQSNRRRTFSNKILTQQKSVQSRRKSHDHPNNSVTSMTKCRSCASTCASNLETISNPVNVCGSFCLKREVTWSEQVVKSPPITSAASFFDLNQEDRDSDVFTSCTEIRSFADAYQPPVERLVNVQRASVDTILREDRPESIKVPGKDVSKERPNFLPLLENNTCESQNTSVDNVDHEKHPRLQGNTSVKTKLGKRRQNLPSKTLGQLNNSNIESKVSESRCSTCQNIKYMRIPSVEINPNQFDDCWDSNWPTLFEEGQSTPSVNEKPAASHLVTSCPNFTTTFSDLQQQLDAVKNNTTPSVTSMYPKLEDHEVTNLESNSSPTPGRAYPRLPSSSTFDSVSFVTSSEEVSFNRKNEEVPVPAPTRPLPQPTPSRLNSIQSSRTVTLTDDFQTDDSLTELPLSDIDFLSPERVNSEKEAESSATGFATLMADFYPDYMNDFILHGTLNHPDLHGKILADLEQGVKNSTLDEPVSESFCIVADTDNWTVKVYSSHRLHSERPSLPALNSKLVFSILHRITNMSKMGLAPDFCLTHLESELRQLVLKSRVLAEYTRGQTRIKMGQLSAALSIESQDLPLLMSIASCHSPHVARMML